MRTFRTNPATMLGVCTVQAQDGYAPPYCLVTVLPCSFYVMFSVALHPGNAPPGKGTAHSRKNTSVPS